MALVSSKDKLVQDFSEFFASLEKVFDTSSLIPAYGKHGETVGGPPVARDSVQKSKNEEQPKGFLQMFDDVKGLKESEYAQIALQYYPVVISVAKTLLPYLENGSPAVFLILKNVGIIGIGLACFAELVVLKQLIEKDCASTGAAARALLEDTLKYTKMRIERNHQRFVEIEDLIEQAKVDDFEENSKKKSVLLIRLQEKIRVCKIDISECMAKTLELYKEMESTIAELNRKTKENALAAAGFGVLAVAGTIGAIVATGGLVVAAGVAAGVTGVATGGLSFRAKLCSDAKHDFIVMKAKCDSLLQDVRRMAERLKSHVMELQDNKFDVGISLADFD